jgi:CubicO group peptidase (beta-lactamase class C family)
MMYPLRPALILGSVLMVAASGRGAWSQQVPQSLRSNVESGLCLRVRIEGRAFQHWTIQDRMRFYAVPGLQIAVIDQGKLAWIGTYGVARADGNQKIDDKTLFEAASATKVVTALTLLRLVDQGTLDLDEPVRPILKSWQLSDPSNSVTIRKLLSHSAAINFPAGETALRPSQPLPTNLDRLTGRAPARNQPVGIDGVPGSGFRYSNGGYLILGQLVSDRTGIPFEQAAENLVTKPLKMTRSTFRTMLPGNADADLAYGHRSDGIAEPEGWRVVGTAEGGLWTTAQDLAKAAIAVQQAVDKTSDFLSNPLAREMLTRQNERWGLGVEVGGTGANVWFQHEGSTPGYKARFFAYATRGQGVVILTNGDRGGELAEEILYSVAAAYHWPDFQVVTQRIIPVDSSTLQAYTGRYQIAPGAFVTVSAEEGKLFAEVRDRGKTELLPDASDHFFMLNGPQVLFVRSPQGLISELVFDGSAHAKKVD